jgi:predicted short-subunit dehydrogenase-like oxidoreductase (DUF2520 family)
VEALRHIASGGVGGLYTHLERHDEQHRALGFPGCLTGPIARGDVGTIRKHLAALEQKEPTLLSLYKALGLETIPIGIAKGTLSQQKADELRQLLSK